MAAAIKQPGWTRGVLGALAAAAFGFGLVIALRAISDLPLYQTEQTGYPHVVVPLILAPLGFQWRSIAMVLLRRCRQVIVGMDLMLHGVEQSVEIFLRLRRRFDHRRRRRRRHCLEAGETPDDCRIDERPARG